MIRRISPKRRKRLSTWAKVSAERLKQTDGRCEVAAGGCTYWAEDKCHHRKLKAQAHDNTIENAVAVCRNCHAKLHALPAWAEANGWIITRRKQ
jgi:predicted SprT family Zn-dependent metalloprotease